MTVLMILTAVPFLKQVFSDITATVKKSLLFCGSTVSWIVCSLFGYTLQLLLDLCCNWCVRSYNSLIKD